MPSKNEWWHKKDPESVAKREKAQAKMRAAWEIRKKMLDPVEISRVNKEAERLAAEAELKRVRNENTKVEVERKAAEKVFGDAVKEKVMKKRKRIGDRKLALAEEQIRDLQKISDIEDPWDPAILAYSRMEEAKKSAEQRLAENPHRQRAKIKELILEACTPEEQKAMVLAMIKKAKSGDVFAFNAIYDRLIGKPNQKVEMEIETTKIDKLIQFIIADPESSRFADDLARRMAQQSGGVRQLPQPGPMGVDGPSRFIEQQVEGRGDGEDQEIDGVDATETWEERTSVEILPGMVSGDIQGSQDHSGELRSELRGQLGPEGAQPDNGESGQAFNKAG